MYLEKNFDENNPNFSLMLSGLIILRTEIGVGQSVPWLLSSGRESKSEIRFDNSEFLYIFEKYET